MENSLKVYTRFESAEIGYNASLKFIYINFFKGSSSDEFRGIWNYALVLKIKHNANNWVLNQTYQNVDSTDLQWIQTVWFSQSVSITPLDKVNPRKIAFIEANDFNIRNSTKEFVVNNTITGLFTN